MKIIRNLFLSLEKVILDPKMYLQIKTITIYIFYI